MVVAREKGLFTRHGFTAVNADQIGHDLISKPSIRDKIVSTFGMDLLTRDLRVDRSKLRKIVFGDDRNLKLLDEIIHPHLESRMKKLVEEIVGDVVIDVALYQELNVAELCDKVILVKADLENVYTRLQERYSKRDVLSIMNSQNIITEADFVIVNDGTIEDLNAKIKKVLSSLR